jgi:hypothetical protein
MSSEEFVYWKAYAAIDPFGNVRSDLQTALLASTLANIHRGPKQQAYQLKDFMLNFQPRQRMTSATAQKEFFLAMTRATGGRVISRKQGEA